MNIQKYLIIIKNKDKTEEVLNYSSDKTYTYINFKDTPKTYKYLNQNFELYKKPINIEIQNHKFMLNQDYIYNVSKIIKFEKHYRIFFEDSTSVVTIQSALQILESNNEKTISINKLEYYKDISKIVNVKTEEGSSLLTNEYKKINFISANTALYKYFNPEAEIDNLNNNINNIIFPFGANKSQFQAVKNAMTKQISIIEGPPGTGKTQTILNINSKYSKKWTNCSCCI